MITYQNKKALQVSNELYLVNDSKINGEWLAVCPQCHKTVSIETFYPQDVAEVGGNTDLLKKWAKTEVRLHKEEGNCNVKLSERFGRRVG